MGRQIGCILWVATQQMNAQTISTDIRDQLVFDVSINKEVYELIRKIPVKENGYIFSFGVFKQSEQLAELLKKLDIKKTTFHGVRDTHASFLLSQDIVLLMYQSD